MSLIKEIIPYTDGNELVAPNLCAPTGRASDNGPMFTSEYIIMLNRNNELTIDYELGRYYDNITRCIGADGELHRAPGDDSPDEIDDHLGVLAGYAEFGLAVNFKLPFRLMRFPQLLFAYLVNKGWPSIIIFPLTIVNALILAVSCIGIPKDKDPDARRLNWLLWQATKRKSILANLAGIFWHYRQRQHYGNEVMKEVAKMYYRDNHPFMRYWID